MRKSFEGSKIVDSRDESMMSDLAQLLINLKQSKLLMRHSDNKMADPNTRIVSNSTSCELYHKLCDN